jgi:hypothetical protein
MESFTRPKGFNIKNIVAYESESKDTSCAEYDLPKSNHGEVKRPYNYDQERTTRNPYCDQPQAQPHCSQSQSQNQPYYAHPQPHNRPYCAQPQNQPYCAQPRPEVCSIPPQQEDCGLYGMGSLGWLLIWFVVFTLVIAVILYFLKPSYVLLTGTETLEVDTTKLLITAVVLAGFATAIVWLVRESRV